MTGGMGNLPILGLIALFVVLYCFPCRDIIGNSCSSCCILIDY